MERRDQKLGFVLFVVFRAVWPRLSVTVWCPEVRYLNDTVGRPPLSVLQLPYVPVQLSVLKLVRTV